MSVLGLSVFRQELVGGYRAAGAERDTPLTVVMQARRPRLLSGKMDVHGHIEAPGLAKHAPLTGQVELGIGLKQLGRYDLSFRADDGRPLRLRGARRFSWKNPIQASSVVDAEIVDPGGKVIARAELRLDYRQVLGRWLRM